MTKQRIQVKPVTEELWPDLVQLFDRRGGPRSCWCTFWRLPGAEFELRSAQSKRAALKRLVDKGEMPGLLAYRAGEPIGWCSAGPRERFKRLQCSSVLRTTDEIPVWSIVCFYIAPEHRSEGVASELLDAAIRNARKTGSKVIGAHPIDVSTGRRSDRPPFTGLPSMFEQRGFTEVERRTEARPILRRTL